MGAIRRQNRRGYGLVLPESRTRRAVRSDVSGFSTTRNAVSFVFPFGNVFHLRSSAHPQHLLFHCVPGDRLYRCLGTEKRLRCLMGFGSAWWSALRFSALPFF